METAKLVLEYLKVLAWPLTLFILIGIFYRQLCDIFMRLRKADLPGGFSLEVKEAKVLSDQVRQQKTPAESRPRPVLPLNQANTIMLNRGLAPSPTGLEFGAYRILAEQDPNLALAGLRMEIESLLKNYAKGNGLSYLATDSAGIISRKLHEHHIISSEQYRLIANLLNLCNRAVHGQKVTREQAETLLETATVLADDFLEWLGQRAPKAAARRR